MITIDLNYLASLDEKIKSGQLNQVKRELDLISKQKNIARKYIIKIANLARRVGYQRLSVKLLEHIVRPNKTQVYNATSEELIEYAISTMRLGSATEALNILLKIDRQKYPDVSLYISFCYFTRWNYKEAIPLLESYIKVQSLSAYQVIVGKINLASAYINSRDFKNAKKTLEDILKNADPEKNKLIIGNAHELYAEYYINQKKVSEASQHIANAYQILHKVHYRYEVYNKKWLAILKLISTRSQAAGIKELTQVRSLAYEKKLYEVIRECDFYESYFTNNKKILTKLYFGTPHPHFRERIKELLGKDEDFDSFYVWNSLEKNVSLKSTFDVHNGVDLRTGKSIKSGSLLHKLLQALCSDLYKPLSTQELFSIIFPTEHFNFVYSTRKIHDLVFRLRNWFSENQIPLSVNSTGRGEFRIQSIGNYGIKIAPFHQLTDSKDYFLSQLKQKIKSKYFSCKDVIDIMGLSRASTKRYLNRSVKSQQLIAVGKGRSAKYSFI